MRRLSRGRDQYSGIYNISNGWYMALANAMVDQAVDDMKVFHPISLEHQTAVHFLSAPKVKNISQIMQIN